MRTPYLFLALAITTTFVSCKKNIEVRETVVSYPYKSEDRSRAKATFTDNGKTKTITIEANNQKFVLDFKQQTTKGDVYERNTISALSTPDSLLITQDNNVIHLGKEK